MTLSTKTATNPSRSVIGLQKSDLRTQMSTNPFGPTNIQLLSYGLNVLTTMKVCRWYYVQDPDYLETA